MVAIGAGVVIDDRDTAFAELEAAGVIAPAGFDDANGNSVYRLLKFPLGEEGLRLRALFGRHVQGGDAAASRGAVNPGHARAGAS
jgi:hypothetical protein